MSPIANSAAAAAFRPGANVTATPASVAAVRSTFTGPPRHTETRRRSGAAANTFFVNGAICVTATSASPSASITWSSVPLASCTPPTGPKGSTGHGSDSSLNSASATGARTASVSRAGPPDSSPAASIRNGVVPLLLLRVVPLVSGRGVRLFVLGDVGDLGGAGRGRVEGVAEPFGHDPLGEFRTDHPGAERDDLAVVGFHGTFGRVRVVRDRRPHTGDLVGRDGDTDAGAADEHAAVGLPRGDLLGGRESQYRIGSGVVGAVHADVDDLADPFVGRQQGSDLVLQCHACIVGGHDHSHQCCPPNTSPIAVTMSANDVAPGSACPLLRSARRAALPLPGSRSAVREAASVAACAALRHAPASSEAAWACSVARNGSTASSMVFSPGLALPRSTNARTALSTAAATVRASGSAWVPAWVPAWPIASRRPAPVSASSTPYRAPEAPPAASAKAVPAASSRSATPSAVRAAATAARMPRVMPSPWSPSAATASSLPSSVSCSSIVRSAAVSARSTMPWPSPAGVETVSSTVFDGRTEPSGRPSLRYPGEEHGAAYSSASSSSSTIA